MGAKKLIRITYEIWDDEDREIGETDDKGWIDEEGESMMPADYWDDQGSAVKNAIDYLRQHGPVLTPGDDRRGGASKCYTDDTYDEDFATGKTEQRSYHLSGFSEAERKQVQRAIKERSYRNNPADDDDIPIANADDSEYFPRLFLIQLLHNQVYVWADSFDSALEVAVEWADDMGHCGVFTTVTEDDLREAAREKGIKWPGIDAFSGVIERPAERILQHAEADLMLIGHTTLKCEKKLGGPAYIRSEDWGGRAVWGDEVEAVRIRGSAVPLRLGYDVFNVFQRYWWGQGDPLYAVLSRRGTSVDWVTVQAMPQEVGRLEEVAEEILEDEDSEAGERRTAQALLKQLEELPDDED